VRVEEQRDDVAYAVTLDATDMKALKAQNIDQMDAVVVAIGRDFESLLLTTVHLLDLKIKRIIARAMNPTQRMILEKMGIKEIISPEVEVGVSVAEQLLNPGIVTFLPLPDDYEIVEINTPPNVNNRTIEDIHLRKRYNLNLITIKRAEKKDSRRIEHHVIGVPQPTTVIHEEDTLILMGKAKDIKRFIDVNN
ncbi:MAG: TrkA family potassium uptake protein, partial [Bacteroidetes bacterium]|nr:TrkA family potassium uptake protein [Bacteroidota bacterium]